MSDSESKSDRSVSPETTRDNGKKRENREKLRDSEEGRDRRQRDGNRSSEIGSSQETRRDKHGKDRERRDYGDRRERKDNREIRDTRDRKDRRDNRNERSERKRSRDRDDERGYRRDKRRRSRSPRRRRDDNDGGYRRRGNRRNRSPIIPKPPTTLFKRASEPSTSTEGEKQEQNELNWSTRIAAVASNDNQRSKFEKLLGMHKNGGSLKTVDKEEVDTVKKNIQQYNSSVTAQYDQGQQMRFSGRRFGL